MSSVLVVQLKAVAEGRLLSVTTLKTPIDLKDPDQSEWQQDQVIGFAFYDDSETFELAKYFHVGATLEGNAKQKLELFDCTFDVYKNLAPGHDELPDNLTIKCIKLSSK